MDAAPLVLGTLVIMLNVFMFLSTVLIWGATWYAIEFQLGVVAIEVSLAYRYALAAALPERGLERGLRQLRATISSAIWMAFRAAPLRRLSETTQRANPLGWDAS